MPSIIRDIPLNKLVLSDANVRSKAPLNGIEELAASIKAHGLLQNLTVRPKTDAKKGKCFEVVAGRRRRAALLLLAKRKQIAKDTPIPCKVAEDGIAEELSLAENVMREPMNPAEEFQAFAALHRDKGMNAEDIAAHFGTSVAIVRQRLKLGAVSPELMKLYRNGELNLDQLSAFAITEDHARQEAVWEGLGHNRNRTTILAALNPEAVPDTDPRARFVGAEAYERAGGAMVRDLFDAKGGGFFHDPVLLDRLVRERLAAHTEAVAAEGWTWIEIVPLLDHDTTAELRRVHPRQRTFTEEEQERCDALEARYSEITEGVDDPDEALTAEIEDIERQIEALAVADYTAEDKARGGAIITLRRDGSVDVSRGWVRAADAPVPAKAAKPGKAKRAVGELAPLPEALIAELTAHRTAALRNELARDADLALAALIHALAASTFYTHGHVVSALGLTPKHAYLYTHAKEIGDSLAMQEIEARHKAWSARLPEQPDELWTFVMALCPDDRLALLAHCTSLTLNAVVARTEKTSLAHADALAFALHLDMRRYWTPTAGAYLGRVSKDRILEAVREGASQQAANNIATLNKAAMVDAAVKRLDGTGWLPPVLRTRLPEIEVVAPQALAAE